MSQGLARCTAALTPSGEWVADGGGGWEVDSSLAEWSMEASFCSRNGRTRRLRMGAGRTVPGRGRRGPRHAPDSIAIVEVDRDGESFTQHYFDSRGVALVYAMAFSDSVWTLLWSSPDFSPPEFWQRFVGEFSADGSTISCRWENSSDGSSGEPVLPAVPSPCHPYRRVPGPPGYSRHSDLCHFPLERDDAKW
jgi:hypothetical protein